MIGATENLPSGNSMKPGDILRARNGTTIEVINTDAEGRLVLADCLHHAVEQGAERLVDLATLTGAIVTTLGTTYAGLMGTDDEWCEEVSAAGRRAGEILWRLPLHPEYADLIKGRYGDILNAVENRRAALGHGGGVPQALRRRRALEPPRHRGRGVGHRQGLRAQGRHRLRRPPARRARLVAERVAADTHRGRPPRVQQGLIQNGRMDFDLSSDHELIRRTVRDFAEGEVAPVAEALDREKRFPYEIVAKLGELGLMGIPFPEEYGGARRRHARLRDRGRGAHARRLARWRSRCARTPRSARSRSTCSAARSRSRSGCRSSRAGRKLGAFGLTEPEAGSDAGNVRTRARRDNGDWVIDGAKQFITNAGTDISGVVCITARTGDEEISNLIVPNGTPGYEQGEPYRKMGWNASDTRPLTFTECRVPEDALLGPRGSGFKQFLHILDIGRIGVAAMGVGLAQGALDEALKYAKERRAFGKPISKFQAIQGKLADMATEIEAARLLTYKAALLKDAGRNFTLTAAQAKLKTGRLAVRATEEAVQIHGGYGYIEEYPVCRMYRDAKILTIGEGTDEVQQMVIARALGA